MIPMQQDEYLLKMVMKNGHVISLICDVLTLSELESHPKYLKMRDTSNDVFVSIEDILAFEIINNKVVEQQNETIPSPAA